MIEELVPATQALNLILADANPQSSEKIALEECAGRVLAGDLKALRTQPPFNASAMDGYGVHQQDIENLPATLNVAGQSAAGRPFTGQIGKNEAVRIFTGAQVPDGIDTIIIQEHTKASANQVQILKHTPAGKFIRKAGLDFSQGDTLLRKNRLLDPQSIGLAASMNHRNISVWKKPLVAIIATGDELVLPGEKLKPGQIIASNSFALAAIAEQSGADAIDMGIAEDTIDSLIDLTARAIDRGADLIVTMGGASVGDHDLVLPAMQKIGFKFEFKKIAMRPGKPFLFAKKSVGDRTIRLLGLAGNPVSSIIAAQVFVRPLIGQLSGLPPATLQPRAAILGKKLKANDERQEYMRASLELDDEGSMVATPFDSQDSSMLANLTRADCLLIRPVSAPAANIGDPCEVVLLR
ncbi:MAG: molybdopterin molybdotransferase MoeA [Rhizobiaceae bacterium]|nr:molybdopterin molybdotransferase MoeA [Rhizobiaceae bacterium]